MKSEWNTGTIAEICSLVTDGSHFSPKSCETGELMVSVKDFCGFGFDFTNCKRISKEDYEKLKTAGCVPEIGDILIGKDGARFFEDIFIFNQPEKPALLSSIAILRCNPDIVLPHYLYYICKNPMFKKDVRDNYGSGSAMIVFSSIHNERLEAAFMARPFSTTDAETLIEAHRDMLRELEDTRADLLSCPDEIKKKSDQLVARSVLNILEDIPIEEINSKAKRSFRVKTLRDNGYRTIADIASASTYSLSSVHGISEDAAYSIKRIANEMTAQARKGCKIRLSTDNKTKEASELVLSIYRYKRYKPLIKSIQQVMQSNRSAIMRAISDLEEQNGTLKWLFSSKAKKQKTMEAFTLLTELQIGSYWTESGTLLSKIEEIQDCSSADAWKDFTINSVQYFNILEEINPGILGNDDALYGLPEDLARDIQEECYFPDGLLCELRRYQEWGVKYILHQERVLLGDEMGLGKTVQAIAAMVSLKNTGATHFLVVCPASVITNWCREIRKMSLLSVTRIHGSTRKASFQSWLKSGGVAVTTFETTAYCTFPASYKFSMLVVDELIDEAAADGRKVIVFSFFLDTIRKISLLLGDRCTNPINGSVTPQRRQEIIDEFDQAPPGTVLIAQIQSGGTGLNIQSASVVIICEPQLKPSIENQAISRAYRMGQTRNVLVYRLLCEDSVDERITALLEGKQEIFDAFADKSEAAQKSKEIDEKTVGNIIQEEIDRINQKKQSGNAIAEQTTV